MFLSIWELILKVSRLLKICSNAVSDCSLSSKKLSRSILVANSTTTKLWRFRNYSKSSELVRDQVKSSSWVPLLEPETNTLFSSSIWCVNNDRLLNVVIMHEMLFKLWLFTIISNVQILHRSSIVGHVGYLPNYRHSMTANRWTIAKLLRAFLFCTRERAASSIFYSSRFQSETESSFCSGYVNMLLSNEPDKLHIFSYRSIFEMPERWKG